MLQIKVINTSSHPLPAYETVAAAGLDIRAYLHSPLVLQSLERALIPTGLFLEIPIGYEAQIRPRSGVAYKKGLTVLNSPGTIDADYRGEVKVLLINLSDKPVQIENGERIAQMVLSSHAQVQWEAVQELSESSRGAGGFGHTGNN